LILLLLLLPVLRSLPQHPHRGACVLPRSQPNLECGSGSFSHSVRLRHKALSRLICRWAGSRRGRPPPARQRSCASVAGSAHWRLSPLARTRVRYQGVAGQGQAGGEGDILSEGSAHRWLFGGTNWLIVILIFWSSTSSSARLSSSSPGSALVNTFVSWSILPSLGMPRCGSPASSARQRCQSPATQNT
jgi:hypothetical protein